MKTPPLFKLAPSYPPALSRARRQFTRAQSEYDSHSRAEDDYGDPIPRDISIDRDHYRRQLRREEQHALHLLRQQ